MECVTFENCVISKQLGGTGALILIALPLTDRTIQAEHIPLSLKKNSNCLKSRRVTFLVWIVSILVRTVWERSTIIVDLSQLLMYPESCRFPLKIVGLNTNARVSQITKTTHCFVWPKEWQLERGRESIIVAQLRSNYCCNRRTLIEVDYANYHTVVICSLCKNAVHAMMFLVCCSLWSDCV